MTKLPKTPEGIEHYGIVKVEHMRCYKAAIRNGTHGLKFQKAGYRLVGGGTHYEYWTKEQ